MDWLPLFCTDGHASSADQRPLRLKAHTITLDTPDGPVNVQVWIGGRGFPVAVLHGLTANSGIYMLWLGFLARLCKVIAMDLPAHGGTDPLPRGVEYLRGSGDLLNRLLDHLGINHAGIIGHSLGGRIACEAASQDTSGRFSFLILADPATGEDWDKRMHNVRHNPLKLIPLSRVFVEDFVRLVAHIRQTDHSDDLIRMGIDTYMGDVRRPIRTLLQITKKLVDAPPSVELLEQIADAGIPTIVIWGDRDQLIGRKAAESNARITHGQLCVVSGGGHSWMLEDRGLALRIIMHSLSDRSTPGSLWDILTRTIAERTGLNPHTATATDLEHSRLYQPGSAAVALTPDHETSDQVQTWHFAGPVTWRNYSFLPA